VPINPFPVIPDIASVKIDYLSAKTGIPGIFLNDIAEKAAARRYNGLLFSKCSVSLMMALNRKPAFF
jgi:hypothetical protein